MTKQTLLILLVIQLYGPLSAQHRKLPPEGAEYSISKHVETPRQTGSLRILSNDTTRCIVLKTDSSQMLMCKDFLWHQYVPLKPRDTLRVHMVRMDSFVMNLFSQGLLTSDLLLNTYNAESKLIDHKGDTIDETRHTDSKVVSLMYVKALVIYHKHHPIKPKRHFLNLEVCVMFNEGPHEIKVPDEIENLTPIYYEFSLYLKGKVRPQPKNLAKYLKTARIWSLVFTGYQI